MKNLLGKVGLFFKGIGTKIGAWPLVAKVLVPVLAVVAIGGGTTAGILIHNKNTKAPVVAQESQKESTTTISDIKKETESQEQFTEKMLVGITVPQKQLCEVATSSIEKDLTIYVLADGESAIKGKKTSIKLVTEAQANSLWDSIIYINKVQDYINQAKTLEEAGASTDELLQSINELGTIELDFDISQVQTQVAYTMVDSKGNTVVNDADQVEYKDVDVSEFSEEEKKEFDTAFATSKEELPLSEKLIVYKDSLVDAYATLLDGIDAKVYTDEDEDGIYHLENLTAGNYYACLIPQDDLDPSEFASTANVKDKIEYVKVEHVVAETVEDTSKEPEREESQVLKDTVTFVKSSSEKILPTYATTTSFVVTPNVSSSMVSSDDITIYQAPLVAAAIGPEESESEEVSPQLESQSYANVLQLTAGVSMYPVDIASAKNASISYVANTGILVGDSLSVKVLKENKTSESDVLTATLGENGKINIVMTKVPSAGTKVYVRLSAKYNSYNEETSAVEEYEVVVDCPIEFLPATTKIKDSSGHELYTDNTHYSNNRTPLTVGNYSTSGTYYYETAAEYMKYYGWQNLNNQRYYFNDKAQVVTGEQIIKGTKYTFGNDGILLTAGTGVDVSRWQGNIDWKKLSSQVSFAIIKCGGSDYGRYTDGNFKANAEGALKNNVAFGLYFFCYAKTEADAVKDASLAIELANSIGGKFALPIYCDYEGSYARSELSKEQNTKNILAFCKTIESAGYKAGVYADSWMLTNRVDMSQLQDYSVWVARYADSCDYKGAYDIWQYSSKGDGRSMGADSTYIDMNKSYFN